LNQNDYITAGDPDSDLQKTNTPEIEQVSILGAIK